MLVAWVATVFCFAGFSDYLNSERGAYNNSKNSYENITQFWLVWDANEWIGGNREAVRNLLNLQTNDSGYQYELREGKFTFDSGKVVTLYASEVFPGINKDMLYMSLNVLDKAAQSAKEQAIENAKQQLKTHEYWGTKSTTSFILIGIVAALAGASIGYLITWAVLWFGGMAIYKFFRWMILGFHDDIPQKN
jgi:hypothetical protein